MKKVSNDWERLDHIDQQILGKLYKEGRITNLDLSHFVNLSPTATHFRVQRLTIGGFILGYEALLNPLLLDAGTVVFVKVLLEHSVPNALDAFSTAVQEHAEIYECHMIAGEFDFLLKTRTADIESYHKFANDVLWNLPGVRRTLTFTAMEEVKSIPRFNLPLSDTPALVVPMTTPAERAVQSY